MRLREPVHWLRHQVQGFEFHAAIQSGRVHAPAGIIRLFSETVIRDTGTLDVYAAFIRILKPKHRDR